jgi:hypothetical protein
MGAVSTTVTVNVVTEGASAMVDPSSNDARTIHTAWGLELLQSGLFIAAFVKLPGALRRGFRAVTCLGKSPSELCSPAASPTASDCQPRSDWTLSWLFPVNLLKKPSAPLRSWWKSGQNQV